MNFLLIVLLFYCAEIFFSENHTTEIGGEDGINFKTFMRALARFRSISSHNHNPLNTREHKLEC